MLLFLLIIHLLHLYQIQLCAAAFCSRFVLYVYVKPSDDVLCQTAFVSYGCSRLFLQVSASKQQ